MTSRWVPSQRFPLTKTIRDTTAVKGNRARRLSRLDIVSESLCG